METIKRTKIVDVLKSDAFGTTVNVKGWVRTRRGSKQVNFIALNDGSTINNVQIVVDVDKLGDEFLKPITTGASISVNVIQLIAKCTWVIKLFRFHHTIIHIAHTIMRIIRVRIRPHQSIARLTSLLVCQINIFQHIRLLMPPHIAQQSTIIGTYN